MRAPGKRAADLLRDHAKRLRRWRTDVQKAYPRSGQGWTPEEDRALARAFRVGLGARKLPARIARELAPVFKRTEAAILSRWNMHQFARYLGKV